MLPWPKEVSVRAGKAPHPCGGGKFLPGTRLRSFFSTNQYKIVWEASYLVKKIIERVFYDHLPRHRSGNTPAFFEKGWGRGM